MSSLRSLIGDVLQSFRLADNHHLDAGQNQSVDRFLRHASALGERSVSLARLLICALALVRLGVFYGDEVVALNPKHLFGLAGLSIGLIGSVMWLYLLRGDDLPRVTLSVSVGLDALLGAVVLLPVVVWPHDGYAGILREPDPAALYLLMVVSSARLSTGAVWTAAVLNGAVLAAMLSADVLWWPARVTYPAGDVFLFVILFVGAGLVAHGFSNFIRSVVRESVAAVMLEERTRERLGLYLPDGVAQQALETDEVPRLGGKREQVAVLFSDLRGFTSASEGQDPAAVVGELNDYLEAVVAPIRQERGSVDKFIGDAVMAVFRDAEPAEAAARAIRAAQGMQTALSAHNTSRAAAGLDPLAQGVGVHFGAVLSGNIGTSERMQHTVIGDVVNLASRLESSTKEYGVAVLISADTVVAAQSRSVPELAPAGAIPIRGRRGEVEVFRFVT